MYANNDVITLGKRERAGSVADRAGDVSGDGDVLKNVHTSQVHWLVAATAAFVGAGDVLKNAHMWWVYWVAATAVIVDGSGVLKKHIGGVGSVTVT